MRLAGVCAVAALLTAFRGVALADGDPDGGVETVVVTANRVPQALGQVESSVTAVDSTAIQQGDIQSSAQAAQRAPNVDFVDFTARSVSNPQFRGVGGSTTNPGVTTYLDGVPQLSADTSSQELLDVNRIEFVRGAQGTLYGRNTLGGVVNVSSVRPDGQWHAQGEIGYGDFDQLDLRTEVGTPLSCERCGLRVAYGESQRDGYTRNTVTGHSLDDRAAQFYKAQAALDLGDDWDARLIAHGEFANDGDFAIGDLAELRQDPNHVAHDFEGRTGRDLTGETLYVSRYGESAGFESITGLVNYDAEETTDLDATPAPDLTRRNRREGVQLTEELRALTPVPQPLFWDWTWSAQGGVFAFSQGNDQNVVNFIAPSYLLESGGIALPEPLKDRLNQAIDPAQDRTRASLDDAGVGGYAQGTVDFGEHWDATIGLRYDVERKHANIDSVTALELAAGEVPVVGPAHVDDTRSFGAFTPRVIVGYAPAEEYRFYASAARGYRAGGFNPVAPTGETAYDEEQSWAYELGAKSSFLDGRVQANLALFLMELDDLQLNIPLEGSPGRFYIDNAGRAHTEGVELELEARPLPGLSLEGALGTLDARFGSGSHDFGEDVGGNQLPFADRLTAFTGADYEYPLAGNWRVGIHGEWVRRGDYFYDATNLQHLGAYDLFNASLWLDDRWITVRLSGRNLADERFVPLALPYTTPSGFAGESSAPRTVGVSVTLRYD